MFVFIPVFPHVSHISGVCIGPYCWIDFIINVVFLILFMFILSSFMKK